MTRDSLDGIAWLQVALLSILERFKE